jgi:predicted DNA-binding transcriptional regulator YafY
MTAEWLATSLEVSPRTIYRDIAALQAAGTPIEGEGGIGYVMRAGYDLPPLMFTIEEVEMIALGARLVRRIRDHALHSAAERVLAKVKSALPDQLRQHVERSPFYVSEGSAVEPTGVDPAEIRSAIRENRKVRIHYVDERGGRTSRTIWPIAMVYYVDATLVGAWCELRSDYRHFRIERIARSQLLDERFPAEKARLMADWLALDKRRPRQSAGAR